MGKNPIVEAIDEAIEDRLEVADDIVKGTVDLIDSGLRSIMGTPEPTSNDSDQNDD